ncbi:MAG: hypothetical protein FWD68_04355 [Alphaproteobacteria bacterium]|nr:hypothetical protein [Alphaproteobacteria bacterium]
MGATGLIAAVPDCRFAEGNGYAGLSWEALFSSRSVSALVLADGRASEVRAVRPKPADCKKIPWGTAGKEDATP